MPEYSDLHTDRLRSSGNGQRKLWDRFGKQTLRISSLYVRGKCVGD